MSQNADYVLPLKDVHELQLLLDILDKAALDAADDGDFTFEQRVVNLKVRLPLPDEIAATANAEGRHLPDGFVDAGYLCDACMIEAGSGVDDDDEAQNDSSEDNDGS